jgi:tetratricopeptide (TPR) repeat protein
MIPQLYFDYLRSGDARPLEGVFYHNAMDILALAALFGHTARMLAHPMEDRIEESLDRVALARLSEDLGHLDEAVLLYRRGLEQGLPEAAFWETVEKLAYLYRRMGNWEAAVALWRQAAEKGQVYACIELAKFFEHRLRDCREASQWTRAALDLAAAGRVPPYQRRQLVAELQHRMDRLERKSRHEIDTQDIEIE